MILLIAVFVGCAPALAEFDFSPGLVAGENLPYVPTFKAGNAE